MSQAGNHGSKPYIGDDVWNYAERRVLEIYPDLRGIGLMLMTMVFVDKVLSPVSQPLRVVHSDESAA